MGASRRPSSKSPYVTPLASTRGLVFPEDSCNGTISPERSITINDQLFYHTVSFQVKITSVMPTRMKRFSAELLSKPSVR